MSAPEAAGAFPTKAAAGAVPPEKVFALGLVVGPGLMLLYFVTLVFISRYRITRERFHEIQTELARRRLLEGTTDP